MGSVKGMSSRAGSAPANSASRTLGKTVGAARALTGPKPHKGSLFGGATRPAGVNGGRGAAPGSAPGASSRGGKSRTPAGAAGSRRAWGGLLGRRNGRSGIAPGGKGAGKRNQGKGGPQGGAGAAKNTGKGTAAGTSGATKAKKKGASGGKATAPGARGTRFSLFRKRRKQGATASPGTGPATGAKPKKGRGAGKKGKVGSAKAPRHRRYTWKQPHLKLAAAAGQFYTRHTSPAFRRRLRTAGKPVRAVYRRVRRHGGKGLANVLRFGGRTVLRVHTALKGVRFSTLGPNWLRPLSRVLSWATSPAAALVTLSRKWGWLNAWIYKTATSRPASAAAGPGGTPAANAPAAGGHQPVPSPASPISPKGSTPVDNSPVQHAYPLMRAAESIRLAGVAFASAPADSMKGYEAVIEHLGSLNLAMFELLQCIATVTEDEFKVNAAVPGAFREISLHFLLLGEFIDGAHVVYRQVHAEQLDNIENPTWQGRKWDISANWGSVIPMHSWAAPQVHAMPLLFAAAAIREAGASIQLHPSGSMVGYEMTIEHLAPLAEELGLLMATVAAVTESEFRVSAAVSEMHRDAGTRFRDLGGWIQAVHVAYRQIHEEQIRNLEEPSYQAAKWDQSRNT
ncbi:hypothetical protein [Streptomyces luteireticuli]|uniref:hypothetical protein n=1 Tax=Streptomyces luteireticuli TaxID=173858 RepID=UPI003556BDCC